jgi:CRISPR/Cas system-associated protein Cas7 (RAMP superfamily)
MKTKSKNKKELTTIIKRLQDIDGITFGALECILGLKLGTINAELKKKEPSKEFMSLFRIINVFPWILNVADRNYDKKYATKELLENAAVIFVQEANKL